MKKVLSILFLALTLIALSACGIRQKQSSDTWERIKEDKRVIIGLDDTFVPMGFQDKDGKIIGFDVELAQAVFKLYGIQADFQAIDWNLKETELSNQTIDLIWNGYTITPERQKQVAFTKTYMKNVQVLVSLKKNSITKFSDMKGKILGAQNGSSGYDVLENQPKVLKQYIKGEPVLYDGFNEALLDLQAGRIQGLLIDKVYADYYLSKEGDRKNYNIVKGSFESEDFAVGARKQDKELIEKINEGFVTLLKNGEFQKISDKWFGENVAPVELMKEK
ncbi:MAG: amino acid ABC transporter substrate-binding protein [Lactobacillales bacterium]|jgi:polar amino acid transport system substrate-binding protein|nr:amino acid ABC transporter substrate-binding protein [Lactobacillales bacterium]